MVQRDRMRCGIGPIARPGGPPPVGERDFPRLLTVDEAGPSPRLWPQHGGFVQHMLQEGPMADPMEGRGEMRYVFRGQEYLPQRRVTEYGERVCFRGKTLCF
jgi:hypothetical protein